MEFQRAKGLQAFILMTATAGIGLTACGGGDSGGSKNELDVGFKSEAPETMDIGIPPALSNYNGKTKAELYELRSKAANAVPKLLKGQYAPTESFFQIDDKGSWWSLKGFLFPQSLPKTEGPSRESAFFGNPFLLVAPEWYADNPKPIQQRFPKTTDYANVFPSYLPPNSIKVYPKLAKEEIIYNIMPHYNMLKSMMSGNWPVSNLGFNLRAYNARDFGYNYIYVDASKSKNIQKYSSDVKALNQGIGSTRACADNCNDIVGTPDDLMGIKLKDIPAQCHILLWKQKPTSYVAPPDMQVDIIVNDK